MTRSIITSRGFFGIATIGGLAFGAFHGNAEAAVITKAATGSELTAGVSWDLGTAPGSGDTAVFDSGTGGGPFTINSTSTSSPDLGTIQVTDSTVDVSITIQDTFLDLGAGVASLLVDMSSAQRDLTLSGGPIRSNASAEMGLNIAAGRTLTLNTGLFNTAGTRTITLTGGGTFLVNGTIGSGNVNTSVTITNGTIGGTGTITPQGSGVMSVAADGTIAPGAGVGTLTIDAIEAPTPVLTMASGADFRFELGAAGTFVAPGSSDLLVVANTVLDDVVFNGNPIDFASTGQAGVYKLFDGLASSDGATDTWSGLTLGGVSGREITAGLTVTNLGAGLSGTLFVGDGASFGDAGDIYVQVVVPEPASVAFIASLSAGMMLRRRRT